MLCLYLQAPFGVFRPFTTGSFRPSATFITYSAAYGLLLNVAGIEMRLYNDKKPMTLIRNDLPPMDIALGAMMDDEQKAIKLPVRHSIYQQLHNYLVGAGTDTTKILEKYSMGNKYNIAPVQRNFLSDIEAYVCVKADDEVKKRIVSGLRGKITHRYGLPFLGDNNFLIDRLEPVESLKPSCWFEPVEAREEPEMREHVARLTITIDREGMVNTRSKLFAPTKEPSDVIPDNAWVCVSY